MCVSAGYSILFNQVRYEHPHQKETTIFDRRLSFLFVLFTFLFLFFSLLLNYRFQRKEKRVKRKEKVALLRKALDYHSFVSSNLYSKDFYSVLPMIASSLGSVLFLLVALAR